MAALHEQGGEASIPEIASMIWQKHRPEIENAGDLLYTWRYEMRWASDTLVKRGLLSKHRGRWYLTQARATERA